MKLAIITLILLNITSGFASSLDKYCAPVEKLSYNSKTNNLTAKLGHEIHVNGVKVSQISTNKISEKYQLKMVKRNIGNLICINLFKDQSTKLHVIKSDEVKLLVSKNSNKF